MSCRDFDEYERITSCEGTNVDQKLRYYYHRGKYKGDQQITFNTVTPILRMFDEDKAKEFYLNFLEFKLDWEHRYEDNLPLYMQISYGKCIIHLSEHHGDCCPGAAIRIETENIEEFHAKLMDKNYKYCRSGLETTPWKTKEVTVRDPFGNRLTFYQNI